MPNRGPKTWIKLDCQLSLLWFEWKSNEDHQQQQSLLDCFLLPFTLHFFVLFNWTLQSQEFAALSIARLFFSSSLIELYITQWMVAKKRLILPPSEEFTKRLDFSVTFLLSFCFSFLVCRQKRLSFYCVELWQTNSTFRIWQSNLMFSSSFVGKEFKLL